jgi:hypothetical protein
VGPLGAQPIPWREHITLTPGSVLLESHVGKCGTCVHAYPKCVDQVGGFSFILAVYILLYIILIALSTKVSNFIIPQVKNKPCCEFKGSMTVRLFFCLVWRKTVMYSCTHTSASACSGAKMARPSGLLTR